MAENPAHAYKVLWWPPDRPVEGNTIYVRRVGDRATDESAEPAKDAES